MLIIFWFFNKTNENFVTKLVGKWNFVWCPYLILQKIYQIILTWKAVAYAGKNLGGFKVMAGLVGGPGGEAPRTPENFRKFEKNVLRKLQKMKYFSIFFKKFNKPCVNFFARLDEKHKLLGTFENFGWKLNIKIEFLSIFGKGCC